MIRKELGMKRIAFVCVLLVMLFSFVPVQALETRTYQFVATSTDTVIPVTTYRDGTILASASFKPSNHGMYHMEIHDAVGHILCYETYDFRWGRSPSMPMLCDSNEYAGQFYAGGLLPAETYTAFFKAATGGKVNVTLSISGETNP